MKQTPYFVYFFYRLTYGLNKVYTCNSSYINIFGIARIRIFIGYSRLNFVYKRN